MADAPTLEEFQAEVTAFLDAHAPRKPTVADTQSFEWGQGSDDVALFEEIDREHEEAAIVRAKAWRAERYDAGFGWITGPTQFGGRDLTQAHERIYTQTESKYDVPDTSYFGIGLGMVAPTILAHAQPQVQQRYLPKLYRGDIVASQLFSEPGVEVGGIARRHDLHTWLEPLAPVLGLHLVDAFGGLEGRIVTERDRAVATPERQPGVDAHLPGTQVPDPADSGGGPGREAIDEAMSLHPADAIT
jgi:hypothetical protein